MMETAILDRFARVATTATAEIDGQLVALDVRAGICFGLNEVATHIWKLLDQHHSIAELCEALLAIYDVDRLTCEQQTTGLLDELMSIGLVTRL